MTDKISDKDLIFRIMRRFKKLCKSIYPDEGSFEDAQWQIMEDLKNVHQFVHPINLQGLLDADDFNFMHDCLGIMKNVDRDKYCFTNHFRPRFLLKESA